MEEALVCPLWRKTVVLQVLHPDPDILTIPSISPFYTSPIRAHEDTVAAGVLPLNCTTVRSTALPPLCFEIITKERCLTPPGHLCRICIDDDSDCLFRAYLLRAESEEDLGAWVSLLTTAVARFYCPFKESVISSPL